MSSDGGTAVAVGPAAGGAPGLGAAVVPPLSVRLWRAAGVGIAASVAFALLYVGAFPCAFARLSHHPCPGCGSTRAVVALLHGDLPGVLATNPLGPAVAVVVGGLGLQSFLSVVRWGDLRGAAEGRMGVILKRLLVGLFALQIALWIARFFGMFGGPVAV